MLIAVANGGTAHRKKAKLVETMEEIVFLETAMEKVVHQKDHQVTLQAVRMATMVD